MAKILPMSYSSIGISISHNNGMKGEVLGSRPTRSMFNLPIIYIYIYIYMMVNPMSEEAVN
jgi:hypothetical protein